MFTAYFDASGDEQQLALAVCGFVATAESWISWRDEWLQRLGEDGLEYFHRRELGNLSEHRQQKLVGDLTKIIQPHVSNKFGVCLANGDLKAVMNDDERREWRVRSYGVAGRTVAADVRRWAGSWHGPMPELVFEKGDAGHGALIHLLKSQGYPSPIFKPKTRLKNKKSGIVEEPAIELQAADLLAGEVCARFRESLQGKPLERLPDALDKVPGEIGRIQQGNLRHLRDIFEQGPDALIHIPTVKLNI